MNLLTRLLGFIRTRITLKNKIPHWLTSSLGIVITGFILWGLVDRQKDELLSFQWEFEPDGILISLFLYCMIIFLTVIVWSQIINSLGGKTTYRNHFQIFCITTLGRRIPGSIWYLPWRIQLYGKEGISPAIISVASGIEMAVTAVSAVITCAIFSFPIILQFQGGLWITALIFTLGLLSLHPLLIRKVLKFARVEPTLLKYSDLLLWIVLYVLVWILVGTLLFSTCRIFGAASLESLTFFIGSSALTGVISRLLFFTQGLIGLTEISLTVLLSSIMPSSLAAVMAIANRIITIVFELIWAVVSTLLQNFDRKT